MLRDRTGSQLVVPMGAELGAPDARSATVAGAAWPKGETGKFSDPQGDRAFVQVELHGYTKCPTA